MNSHESQTLMPEAEYRRQILALVEPISEVEVCNLDVAFGRVLASKLTSKVDLPPFRNSAMDGYAVRAAETTDAPVTLQVLGDIPAGASGEVALPPGTVVRIMTGAPVPDDADAVIQVEWTDRGTEQVVLSRSVTPEKNVRGAAEDLATGDLVGSPGEVVDPGRIGLLAASGHAEVPVLRRPRVAVVATGDELYPVGTELPPGGIYDSNSHQDAALVLRAGAEVGDKCTLSDDIDQAVESMRALAANNDLIVTSGGVSAGAYEVVKEVFARLGGGVFTGVDIQPGKPQGHGVIDGTPVVALPGNPLSALVSFELFVRPLIRKLRGLASGESVDWESPELEAGCAADLARRPDRTRYLPAVLDYRTMQVETPVIHGSHRVSTAANMNCMIRVPGQHLDAPGSELAKVISAGSTVRVVLIH